MRLDQGRKLLRIPALDRVGNVLGNELRDIRRQSCGPALEALARRTRHFLIDDLTAEGVRVNQLRIVEATGMDRSTLTEVLRRLELRKLVARKRDKNDRRSLHVTLTGTGQELISNEQVRAAYLGM